MAETADGTLIIIVCRAKHLPNRRKLDKQSPYVTMRIGPTATKTPSHFRAGQTPEWTHEVRFQLTRDRKPMMKLDVLDETKDEPTPIGSVEIDCLEVFVAEHRTQGKYIFDKWWDLSFNGKRAGMIYLEMTFYPSAPILPPKVPILHQHVVSAPAEDETFQGILQPTYSDSGIHNQLAKLGFNPPPKHPRQQGTAYGALYFNLPVDEVFVTEKKKSSGSKFLKSVHQSHQNHQNHHQNHQQNQQKHHSTHQNNHQPHRNSHSSPTLSAFVNAPLQQESQTGSSHRMGKIARIFQEKRPVGTFFTDRSAEKLRLLPRSSKSPIKYTEKDLSDAESEESIDFVLHLEEKQLPGVPPNPPPHTSTSSYTSSIGSSIFQPTPGGFDHSGSSYGDSMRMNKHDYELGVISPGKAQQQAPSTPKKSTSSSVSRKPPPEDGSEAGSLVSSFHKLNFGGASTTSIPFSANSIGLDENHEDIPTLVYMNGNKVQSLTEAGRHHQHQSLLDELDPKYYAPQPTEYLSKTLRLQNGRVSQKDVQIDLRTDESGYMGAGKWKRGEDRFSPLVFDRLPPMDEGHIKPQVPPKVPTGLLEIEYYVLDKERFLNDLKGERV